MLGISKYRFFLLLLPVVLLTGCHPVRYLVGAKVETTPVKSTDDAADDPAIFIHPTSPENNAIIGTNKQSGLNVYRLTGELLHQYSFGKINNVDIRSEFRTSEGKPMVLVGGSNRSDNSISLFELSPATLELNNVAARKLTSSVDEVYGFCFYQNTKTYALVIGKDGVLEQWLLEALPGGKVDGRVVRTLDVGGQCEGMVADDESGYLYIAEENHGIWKYPADPASTTDRTLVDAIKANRMLKADIEGLALYRATRGQGYLIASSQGNNSYAIYERQNNNRYLGSFRIAGGTTIDGTSETDGIDVVSAAAGPVFPNGFFVVQDGKNHHKRSRENQNFKLVPWEDIAGLFPEQLLIDPHFIKQP